MPEVKRAVECVYRQRGKNVKQRRSKVIKRNAWGRREAEGGEGRWGVVGGGGVRESVSER